MQGRDLKMVAVRSVGKKNVMAVTPQYLSVDDASVVTGLSVWTIRRWCYVGKLASVKAGKRLLVPVCALEEFMAAHLRPAVSEPASVFEPGSSIAKSA
jgi:excisionase family DNA binding protein